MTLQLDIPESLVRQARELAHQQQVSVDQIVALALSAQVSAWKVRDDIETRARRGRPEDLRDILAKVPDVPPLPGDELPEGWKK